MLKFCLFFLFAASTIFPQHFSFNEITSIDSSLSIRGIYAINSETVYISGSKGSLYFTNNSGKTFNKINVPGAEKLDFRDIQVFDDESILLMSSGSGEASKIYKTTNQGIMWQIVYTNKYKSGFLNSIAFFNNKEGIVVGDPVNGKLFLIQTKDGGDTWEEIKSSSIPNALKNEMGFAASGTSITTIKEKVFTVTGGKEARLYIATKDEMKFSVSNTPILHGGQSTGIYSVHFYDEQNGFLVGGDYTKENDKVSTYSFTEDGGITWKDFTNSPLPFQSAITSIISNGKRIFVSTGRAGTYISEDKINWERIGDGYYCLSTTQDNSCIWFSGSFGRVAKLVFN